MISYDKLWNTMKKRKISQYALKKKYGISPGQITRLKRNESVSTHTIETVSYTHLTLPTILRV